MIIHPRAPLESHTGLDLSRLPPGVFGGEYLASKQPGQCREIADEGQRPPPYIGLELVDRLHGCHMFPVGR